MRNNVKTWKVKAYIEYDIEATDSEEAIIRFGQCIIRDLDENGDPGSIAEVSAEKISDEPMSEDGKDDDFDENGGEDVDYGEEARILYQSIPEPQLEFLNKSREYSVTPEIIKEVHQSLADKHIGEETIDFLKSTEPVFMDEVERFVQTEMSRMRYQITDEQAIYMLGSVMGAAYVSGFLIARNTGHKIFGGLFNIGSTI